MEKIRGLNLTLQSPNPRLHRQRFSGSQPSLCTRRGESLVHYRGSPLLSSPLHPCSPSSFPPLLPSFTASQAKLLENQDIEQEEEFLAQEMSHVPHKEVCFVSHNAKQARPSSTSRLISNGVFCRAQD